MTKAAQLFDAILHQNDFKNDAALAAALDIDPPNLSRLRHGHRPVSDGMVLKIHDVTGWAIRDIKGALDLPCRKQVALA